MEKGKTKTVTENAMKKIKLDKVTLNIGAGSVPENLSKAFSLLEKISGKKVVKTFAKKRIATWKIRQGLPIGSKVTVRGKDAEALLQRLLKAVKFEISRKSFGENGFSFGIAEYIDIPDVKYEPKIGIIGLDVSVTLARPGFRVTKRKLRKSKISKSHKINKQDSVRYAESIGVKLK